MTEGFEIVTDSAGVGRCLDRVEGDAIKRRQDLAQDSQFVVGTVTLPRTELRSATVIAETARVSPSA